jgi:hypothetical protein
MQPVPEDVFFAAAIERRAKAGAKRPDGTPFVACSTAVAARFAFEARMPDAAGPRPLGMHKPWAYVPRGELASYIGTLSKQ